LKTGDGSLRGVMADEEGMSDRIAASADGLGVCSFPYVINRIFLVGERVGHPQDHLGSQMNKIKGKGSI
jgi:hypothetical protein